MIIELTSGAFCALPISATNTGSGTLYVRCTRIITLATGAHAGAQAVNIISADLRLAADTSVLVTELSTGTRILLTPRHTFSTHTGFSLPAIRGISASADATAMSICSALQTTIALRIIPTWSLTKTKLTDP